MEADEDRLEPIQVDLTRDERELLITALNEWGGPARPTIELLVALGFAGHEDFTRNRARLAAAIEARDPLSALDWCRLLVSSEVVFVSDIFGSGYDWQFTSGWTDQKALEVLRGLQRRLAREARVHRVPGNLFGTRP